MRLLSLVGRVQHQPMLMSSVRFTDEYEELLKVELTIEFTGEQAYHVSWSVHLCLWKNVQRFGFGEWRFCCNQASFSREHCSRGSKHYYARNRFAKDFTVNVYKGGVMRRVISSVKYAIRVHAPPPIFRFGGLPMNLRGNWQITRRYLNNPRIIAMVSTDHTFLDPDDDDDDDDEYAVSASRSILCCRTVAIIFMILLILRHTLPIIVSRAGNYSFPLIMLLMLRIMGIILPICVILKAVTSIIRRRKEQANLMSSSSDEESSPLAVNQPHVIRRELLEAGNVKRNHICRRRKSQR